MACSCLLLMFLALVAQARDMPTSSISSAPATKTATMEASDNVGQSNSAAAVNDQKTFLAAWEEGTALASEASLAPAASAGWAERSVASAARSEALRVALVDSEASGPGDSEVSAAADSEALGRLVEVAAV